MGKISLTVSCGRYDRTVPIWDGRVSIEGCDVNVIPLDPEEVFFRALRYAEFDVAELSFNSYLMATSRGACPYVALPAFVSRYFRHSAIYVRTGSGIEKPEDLKGRKIGVPEYQMTAIVFIRGILSDEYGVKPSDIHWRTGGQEEPGRGERTPLDVPEGIDIQPIPTDQALCGMLERGELDGLITARHPSLFMRGEDCIQRLFPDYPTVEQAYFRKTGIFPIMHVIGVRKTLLEREPWLASSVYKAFLEARDIAMWEIANRGGLRLSLPWIEANVARARELLGGDYWPYGVEENRKTIETLVRYSHDQGLLPRLMTPEEIFAEQTLEISKV
jgi:4,5-dihydroxyphthalate decarboxylase